MLRIFIIPFTLLFVACDYPAKVGPSPDSPNPNGPNGPACDQIAASFEDALWRPALSQCVICHRSGGLAASSDLVLVPASEPGALTTNMARFAEVASQRIDGESVLLLRPTGRHPLGHPGGAPIDLDSDAYRALERFVASTATCNYDGADPTVCQAASPRLLRRLSRTEWARTLTDLLGLSASPEVLAPDDVVHGFDNDAKALTVSSLLADQLRSESERLARLAIDTRLSALIDCNPTNDQQCASRFIREVGLRAFRRPLSEAELATYQAFYDTAAATPSTPKEGLVWALAAMLQSPHFLYRSELGARRISSDSPNPNTPTDPNTPTPLATFSLTDWELASALSYLAWGTMPDDTLFRKAAAKAFTTAADPAMAIADELARLLADPRADHTLERFALRWLRLDLLTTVIRDQTLYPPLTPELRRDMITETTLLFIEIARSGGTLADLLSTRHSHLNDRLIAHYGLTELPAAALGTPNAQGFSRVDLSTTPYGGLLSHGSLMTTHALPLTISPIHRGKLIRERLLCEDLPPPPSNLNTSPPPMDPTKSTRERYAQHSSDESCRTCHEKIDPIGFGFERFDPVGRVRTMDGVHPIDEAGSVFGLPTDNGLQNLNFSGPLDLAAVLSQSDFIDRCYLLQQARFSLGHEPASCTLDALHQDHLARGGSLLGAFAALVSNPGFATRRGDASELDTLAVGDWDFDDPSTDPLDPIDPVYPTDPTDPTGPTGQGILWERVETSRWQSGYCVQVNIRNTDAAPRTWAIEMPVDGAFANLWSATAMAVSGNVHRFVGVEYNATLGAGQSTNFGFCANLQ